MLKGNGESQMSALEVLFFFRFSQHACSPSARHRCVLAHTVDPQPKGGGVGGVQGHLSSVSADDWHLRLINSLQDPLV